MFVIAAGYFFYYSYNMNYQKTIGIITPISVNSYNIPDKYMLTYSVDKEYRVELPAIQEVNGKPQIIKYHVGNNSVYYPKNSPDMYNLGFNPLYFSEILFCVLCSFLVAATGQLIVSYLYPEVGAALGAINMASSFFNSIGFTRN